MLKNQYAWQIAKAINKNSDPHIPRDIFGRVFVFLQGVK